MTPLRQAGLLRARVLAALSLVLCLLSAGCASSTSYQRDSIAGEAVDDDALGPFAGSPLTPEDPAQWHWRQSDPGEEPLLPRPHDNAPRLIPHGIRQLTPILREDNACLQCHGIGERLPGDPVPLPASHFFENPQEGVERRDQLTANRFDCLTCHLPQSDAPPLVENAFTEVKSAKSVTPAP